MTDGKFNFIKPIKYKKDFMIIRFGADKDLPLGKLLSVPVMVITGSVFGEDSKYYPQVLLHEWVYEL